MKTLSLIYLLGNICLVLLCVKSLVGPASEGSYLDLDALAHEGNNTDHSDKIKANNIKKSSKSFFFVAAAARNILHREGSLPSGLSTTSLASINHNSRSSLPAVRIDASGAAFNVNILKSQLANDLNLPLRDLRVVDPTFPSQIQAAFVARPKVILFTVENIKVVVKAQEVFIFNPNNLEVQKFIPILQQQLLHNSAQPHIDSTTQLLQPPYNTLPEINAPFEHVVIETALNVVCNSLATKTRRLEPAVASALNDLRAESRGLDVIRTQVDELLPLKNQLDELHKRAKEVKRAIAEVLLSDEDMALMFLSPLEPLNKLPADKVVVDTMSLEMLLENYLNEIEWIAAEVDDILDEVTNTEENVVLQLDLLRNRILKFELKLSISTFIASCGALLTGLFGMNLVNHFESNPATFYILTAFIAMGMFTGFRGFIRFAKREKLL